MSENSYSIFVDKHTVAKKAAQLIHDLTLQPGKKHIALSGGSTPKLLFSELASSFRDSIDWTQIYFYWGDERCVPPTDDDSNFKMTKELLLDKINIPADNVKRIVGEENPSKEAERYEKVIKEETGSAMPSFDLIILGMGEDGHTASIFPHQMHLLESDRLCEVATHPESGQKRVTMTGKLINEAAHVLFLVTGNGKKEKIRQIFMREGPFLSYPAAHIDPKGKLEWYLDQEAASEL